MNIQELGHAGMYVRDLAASAHFYRDQLGFTQVGCVPGAVFLSSGRSHTELVLIQPGPDALDAARQPAFGLTHIALKIGDSLDELRAARAELMASGISIARMEDFTIFQSLHVQDPDGNDVELYADTNPAWRQDPHVVEHCLPKPLVL